MATKFDYHEDSETSSKVFDDGTEFWQGMVFTASRSYQISSVEVNIRLASGTSATLTAVLYSVGANGKPVDVLASGTADVSSLTGSYEWVTVTFSAAYTIFDGTKYCIVLKHSTADNLAWGLTTSGYTGGNNVYTTNDGVSWTVDTEDMNFRANGDEAPPDDKIYSKQLVAIGNDEVWYESSAGTMEEIAAANSDITCALPLTAVEGFQKVFVANRTNLKVIDFANIKLTTADILPSGKTLPVKGDILTGQTSLAEIIVDYVNATDGAASIYGIRTNTASFILSETVQNTGATVQFVLNANEIAGPHWYDWTPYSNDTTTYGSMPSEAYISCLYRGRLVLAGHRSYPHQWYMSKVGDPWNWLYGENDPLTAIAGQDADAGLIGDVIRVLIPYSDDYLLFGCASSIWRLSGDPASSGSIDEVSRDVGMYGFKAWCFDSKRRLFFMSASGDLYRLDTPLSQPMNLSEQALPELIEDWALNPSTDRVVLTFDPLRNGIIISKTTLASGVNLNYWYDLNVEGFFPETYPNACGIFCGLNYQSDASGTRKLILGSNDGYLRSFEDSAKDDDSGGSDTAISSDVTFPLIIAAEDAENKLTSLTFYLAGGAASGSFSDTDGVTWEIYTGDDAETVLEDILDGATPQETGTLSGTGRKNKVRRRVRGRAIAIRLKNTTATETWAVEKIIGKTVPAGES
jgi:hypothetical protein